MRQLVSCLGSQLFCGKGFYFPTHPGDGQRLVEVFPSSHAKPPGGRTFQHDVQWHDPLNAYSPTTTTTHAHIGTRMRCHRRDVALRRTAGSKVKEQSAKQSDGDFEACGRELGEGEEEEGRGEWADTRLGGRPLVRWRKLTPT